MSRPFKIEITKNEEELKKRLQTASFGNQKEKLQMLWWLKSGQVKQQQEIGKCLALDTSTVTRWLHKYRSGGLSSLSSIKKAGGAKRKINDAAIAALKGELEIGKGFSSYGAIVTAYVCTTMATCRYNKLQLIRLSSAHSSPAFIDIFRGH